MSKWIPVESNPDVLNRYSSALGAIEKSFLFSDIYGLDPELLAMVPPNPLAVLVLFPITSENEAFRNQLAIASKEQVTCPTVWFARQLVDNACGTMGIIHALLNNADCIPFAEGSYLHFLRQATQHMTADQRAQALAEDKRLEECHAVAGAEGQTEVPQNRDVPYHFSCFVLREGLLIELDGRMAHPVIHGKSSKETFLMDVASVVKAVMALNPTNVNFNLSALCGA